MTKTESIYNKLRLFVPFSATPAQWNVILKGAGCPNSCHFWKAFKTICLKEMDENFLGYLSSHTIYMMNPEFNLEMFEKAWDEYCTANRASVKKVYYKKKAQKKTEQWRQERKALPCYLAPDGTITINNPNIHWDKD